MYKFTNVLFYLVFIDLLLIYRVSAGPGSQIKWMMIPMNLLLLMTRRPRFQTKLLIFNFIHVSKVCVLGQMDVNIIGYLNPFAYVKNLILQNPSLRYKSLK